MPITLNGTLGIDAPLGTSSVPSYGNTTNTNTGLYFPSSTTLGLSTNGTAALTIDASQNVGIGTSSPAVKLDINGTNPSVRIVQTVGGYENYLGVDSGNLAWNGSTNGTSWGVKTNNVERMRIDTSGNVGIGTTSPSTFGKTAILTSAGSGSGGPASTQTNSVLSLSGTTTGAALNLGIDATGTAYGWIQARNSGSATYYDLALQPSGGNVGIGTSSPAASLSVVKQTTALSGTGNSYGLYMYPTSSGLTYIDAITGSTGNTSLGFRTYNNGTYNEMRMDSSGNVGIGTSSPSYGLDVGGTTNAKASIRIQNGTAGSSFLLQSDTSGIAYVQQQANAALVFATNNTERARIDSSGNLLVGTTVSTAYETNTRLKLNTSGTAQVFNQLQLVNSGSPAANGDIVGIGFAAGETTQYGVKGSIGYVRTADYGRGAITFYTNNTAGTASVSTSDERMRIDSSGNLLVGQTSTNAAALGASLSTNDGTNQWRLSVGNAASTNAGFGLSVYSTGAAAYRFYVGMAGTIFATSTTISAISDKRFKENIRDLDTGLDAVMALKPRLYDWKQGKGADVKNARGFIAQEFEQVFPDLIDEWADPAPEGEEPYKSVRQDLIPVLVKAIQELKTELDALKGTK